MDFTFSEEQQAVRDLAAKIFEDRATVERIKEIEASEERIDRRLWADLAEANLLGVEIPDEFGGAGLDLIAACLLLEQQGRRVAPVPLLGTLVVAAALAAFGTPEQRDVLLPAIAAGESIAACAVTTAGDNDPTRASLRVDAGKGRDGSDDRSGVHLTGRLANVAAAHVAGRVLAAADDGAVYLFDPRGPRVVMEHAFTTNREVHPHLHLDGAAAERIAVTPTWVAERMMVGLCALQLGVAEEAIRQAAAYSSTRVQFGRPLSTFQGAALKAADAYIDTEAIRATLWQAAWRLEQGLDASAAVHVAKWWAAEGGQRVVHITQHLHGGIGADIEYPIHRYFLWGKQIELQCGGVSAQLARLGAILASQSGDVG